MSNQATLSAATQDRKARLAQLKSLKRKQPSENDDDQTSEVTTTFLSGRNYDAVARGPKLGFENAPVADTAQTLEAQAQQVASTTREAAAAAEKEDEPLDLFKLQPKKPNWDLKRDLEKKLEVLNVRTDNAIARLVRDRIEQSKNKNQGDDDIGIDGNALVEAMHAREREEQLEREQDEDD